MPVRSARVSSARFALALGAAAAACSRTTELQPTGTPSAAGRPFLGEYIHPGAPSDIRDSFGGPPQPRSMATPRFVYPLDGAMLMRNWGGMNLQWAAGDGNHLFRVTVDGQRGAASIYAGDGACPAGQCAVPVPDALWLSIASAHADAEVQIRLDATTGLDGPVSTGQPLTLTFSPEDFQGDLLYWSNLNLGLVKVPSGSRSGIPFIDAKTPAAPGRGRGCVGCHAVSADGCLIAMDVEENGYQYTLGVAQPKGRSREVTTLTVGDSVSFAAIHPDGKRILTVRGGVLTLRDRSGMKLTTIAAALVGPAGNDFATHPQWAPDGRAIVFTRLTGGNPPGRADWTETGDIAVMPFDADQPRAARVLVPRASDESHFYPHVSPDGRWVVFNTGRKPGRTPLPAPTGNLSSYAQSTARLRMVAFEGGQPIELGRATHAPDSSMSSPSFTPFAQRRGTLLFLSFSAKLDYGWVLDQASVPPIERTAGVVGAPGRAQLWMAALDLTRPGDPSMAPFWLPMQDVKGINRDASWIPNGTCPP